MVNDVSPWSGVCLIGGKRGFITSVSLGIDGLKTWEALAGIRISCWLMQYFTNKRLL